MEIKVTDSKEAQKILKRDYINSTGLVHHDTSRIDVIFNENSDTAVCPACGTKFNPIRTTTCPECELSFG